MERTFVAGPLRRVGLEAGTVVSIGGKWKGQLGECRLTRFISVKFARAGCVTVRLSASSSDLFADGVSGKARTIGLSELWSVRKERKPSRCVVVL